MLKTVGWMIAVAGMLCSAQAQQTLSDLAAEAGVEWLMGAWKGQSDSGDTVELSIKPDLNNHIAMVRYKDSQTESKGMILIDPMSNEPKYYSGNTEGGFGTGVWTAEYGKAILKYKVTTADWETVRMGITFRKIDAQTMEVAVFDMNTSDELTGEARMTTKFKRQP